jgi:hypothetical protein
VHSDRCCYVICGKELVVNAPGEKRSVVFRQDESSVMVEKIRFRWAILPLGHFVGLNVMSFTPILVETVMRNSLTASSEHR